MPSVKKFNGNLVIQTPFSIGVASNITLDTDYVYVTGNLTVQGNTTTVTSNNLVITDNVIVLNKGETGGGVTKGNAGILIDRGSQIASQLQWNENLKTWQASGNSAVFANVLTSTLGNIGLTSVFDDKAPVLGGNLNVSNFILYANIGSNIAINGNVTITNTVSSDTTKLYVSAPGVGGVGIFTINSQVADEELITKKRAIGFSLYL